MNKKELIKNLKEVDNETEIKSWILENLISINEIKHYLLVHELKNES